MCFKCIILVFFLFAWIVIFFFKELKATLGVCLLGDAVLVVKRLNWFLLSIFLSKFVFTRGHLKKEAQFRYLHAVWDFSSWFKHLGQPVYFSFLRHFCVKRLCLCEVLVCEFQFCVYKDVHLNKIMVFFYFLECFGEAECKSLEKCTQRAGESPQLTDSKSLFSGSVFLRCPRILGEAWFVLVVSFCRDRQLSP